MDLLQLIVVLAIVGLVLYLLNRYIPMEPRFKELITTIAIIAAVVYFIAWLCNLAGLARLPIRIW